MALENLEPETRLEWFIYHAGQGPDGGSDIVSVPFALDNFLMLELRKVWFLSVDDDGTLFPDSLAEKGASDLALLPIDGSLRPPYIFLSFTSTAIPALDLQKLTDMADPFSVVNTIRIDATIDNSFPTSSGAIGYYLDYADVPTDFFEPGYAYRLRVNLS